MVCVSEASKRCLQLKVEGWAILNMLVFLVSLPCKILGCVGQLSSSTTFIFHKELCRLSRNYFDHFNYSSQFFSKQLWEPTLDPSCEDLWITGICLLVFELASHLFGLQILLWFANWGEGKNSTYKYHQEPLFRLSSPITTDARQRWKYKVFRIL